MPKIFSQFTTMDKHKISPLRIIGIIIILSVTVIIILMKIENSLGNNIKDGLLNLITKSLLSSKVPKIDVGEAAAHQSSYIFLDSREKDEYDVSHIKNSIFVGAEDFAIDKLGKISKDADIVVYCAVGVRSDKIAKEIIDAGYRHVHNMHGGIFEWINKGNPVYDTSGNPTSSIHAYSKFWGVFVSSDHKVYK
ncbi:MAG: rhodanese-like domain-containing protein [Ginsengibacter sp.]